jgi:glycosyltransferase involved in cell wall biosynthesis
MKTRVIWLGPIVEKETIMSNQAVSPAGNRWQTELIKALIVNGCKITIIGHVPHRMWPRGAAIIKSSNSAAIREVSNQHVGYSNIPVFRSKTLSQGYLQAIKALIPTWSPTIVISYNATPENVVAGNYAKLMCGIPWVCIVADTTAPAASWVRLGGKLKNSSGNVFLSWKSFNDFPGELKFHLDGGVEEIEYDKALIGKRDNFLSETIFLYAGNMDTYAGLSNLVKGFKKLSSPKVKLWICGKGNTNQISHLISNDTRIKYFGLVSEEKLKQLYRNTHYFVNPRKINMKENDNNFPSKILDYLSYCKPILSTWTPGLHPNYRKVLKIIDDDTPRGISSVLEEVSNWRVGEYLEVSERIFSFVYPKKRWKNQAKAFGDWLVPLNTLVSP